MKKLSARLIAKTICIISLTPLVILLAIKDWASTLVGIAVVSAIAWFFAYLDEEGKV